MCATSRPTRSCPKCGSHHVEGIQEAVIRTFVCRACGHLWSAAQPTQRAAQCPDCGGMGKLINVESDASRVLVHLECPSCGKQWTTGKTDPAPDAQ